MNFRKTFIRGPPYNAYKNTRKKKQKKGQNRTSEIRFTGVPPIMPIKIKKIYLDLKNKKSN